MSDTRDKVLDMQARRTERYGLSDGLAAFATRCEGLRLARDTIVYQRGTHRQTALQSHDAYAMLSPLSKLGPEMFDPATWESTRRLIEKLSRPPSAAVTRLTKKKNVRRKKAT